MVWGRIERMSMAATDPKIWVCEYLSGTAQELHRADMSAEGRCVRLNSVSRPAIVLGSSQLAAGDWAEVAERSGADLARRRSGGGAVWLAPGEQCWVDLWLPSGDPLWCADVGQSSWWLGECWAQALTALDRRVAEAGDDGEQRADRSDLPTASLLAIAPQVHRGPMIDRELGQIACFAGLGPGEVSVNYRKIVGISQRRSRLGARFQCVVYTTWNPELFLTVLQSGDSLTGAALGAPLQAALRSGVGVVRVREGSPPILAEQQIFEALRAHLPVE